MPRKLTTNGMSFEIKGLLEKLIDPLTGSQDYASTMYELGRIFGSMILQIIGHHNKVALASTVEDADNLGKGILDELEKAGKEVLLTVFWNKRFKPNDENGISVAPIMREFQEPGSKETSVLIVIKSIIANSCVVRTNLTSLIEGADPELILVVAPVLLKGAKLKLEKEFDPEISKKFEYLYFAEDDEKTDEGNVLPGIGGNVYNRLGFEGQDSKNRFTPILVKERRLKYS